MGKYPDVGIYLPSYGLYTSYVTINVVSVASIQYNNDVNDIHNHAKVITIVLPTYIM